MTINVYILGVKLGTMTVLYGCGGKRIDNDLKIPLFIQIEICNWLNGKVNTVQLDKWSWCLTP